MSIFDRIKGPFKGRKVSSSYLVTDEGQEELAKRCSKGDIDSMVLLSITSGGSGSPRAVSRDTSLPIDKVEKSIQRLEHQGWIRPAGSSRDYD